MVHLPFGGHISSNKQEVVLVTYAYLKYFLEKSYTAALCDNKNSQKLLS